MDKDLTVLKVKDFKKKTHILDKELHPNLPVHPFLMVISSSPRSGKTNLLLNMVASSNYYNIRDKEDEPYFDTVYWISPTQNFDIQTKSVLKKLDNVTQIDDLDDIKNLDLVIKNICDGQKELNDKEEPMKRILIVIDDCVSFLEPIAVISSKYRHYGVSIIISLQKYTKCPLLIRTCMGHFITFKQNNGKEREKITEEIGDSFCPPKEFENILQKVTAEKYNFLYLNLEQLKMYENFKTLLLDAS